MCDRSVFILIGLLSLNGWWGLDTTAEARRFARLLEERDGLWKIGTVRIIWSLGKLSKYVGGSNIIMRPVKTPLFPTGELVCGDREMQP